MSIICLHYLSLSDDGSRLLLGDYVVDNNQLQAAKAKANRVNLSAGTYPLTLGSSTTSGNQRGP